MTAPSPADVPTAFPALCLVASPGKRKAVVELAVEAEQRGFAGIACPSLGGGALGLSVSLAHATREIAFWTSVQPIYLAHPAELAATASHIQEMSGGRFGLGLGVSHAPVHERLEVHVGRPLLDMREYVAAVRKAAGEDGPQIYLAAMRDRMLGLAGEIADGAIWANACRSAMAAQLGRVPAVSRDAFFLANMVPTVIDDDRQAARAVNRRTMTRYLWLPNYRNYWRAVGYAERMDAVEAALAAGRRDEVGEIVGDDWLDDVTLSGPAVLVRDGLDAWAATGVLPIATMSSTSGGQVTAVRELFAAYEA